MNLFKLELLKIKLSTYLWAIAGIFASLLALGVLFLIIFQFEMGASGTFDEEDLFANWEGLLALTTALSFACFSIFSAVIAAKVIINEYCEKNAVILLSYPINRKSILKTKCIIVCAITAISACISNLLVVILMFLTAQIFHIMPKMNTEHFALFVLFSSILMGILSSAVGIISVVCGWKKRSVIATIVCSLIVVCSTTNLIAAYPNHILWIMLAMSVIFIMIAHFLYHILTKEIEKLEV